MVQSIAGHNFRWSGVYNAASYDLSGGDTLTMKMSYAPLIIQNAGTTVSTPVNQVFQLGFVDSTSAEMGDGSSNGVWIGGLQTAFGVGLVHRRRRG